MLLCVTENLQIQVIIKKLKNAIIQGITRFSKTGNFIRL